METDPLARPVLDTGYMMSISDGDRDIIDSIVDVFKDDIPARIDELARAASAGELEETARVAHALKGASGSLGAEQLQAISEVLEQAAKAGDTATCQRLATELPPAAERLFARLETETWST